MIAKGMLPAILAVATLLLCSSGFAQQNNSDSLTIDQAVQLTVANHPLIQRAMQVIKVSEAQVGVAQSPSLPEISGSGGFTRIGPVPQFELPGLGKEALAPYNNYDVHLGLRYTLYDFDRTATAVEYARSNLQTVTDSVEYVKWTLAYQVTAVFDQILILRQSIAVLDEQLDALDQHQLISQKRVETGTATKLDVLTTQVRVASANSARIDAVNALRYQEILFRQLVGFAPDRPVLVRGEFTTDVINPKSDSLLQVATKQRTEIKTALDAETSAGVMIRLAELGNKPTFYLALTSGFKNGYEPNIQRLMGNYTASLNLQAPIFDGYRTHHQKEQARASLLVVQARLLDLQRRIAAEVEQALSATLASQEKIGNAQVQVDRAEEAVTIAKGQYAAGVNTNLDLLDAQTSLSEAKLMLLRARYDYVSSLNALDRATGKKIW
jgi:outer membrane protein